MIDVENELREAFASRTAGRPAPLDLADRVITRGTTVRRRRLMAISAMATSAVVLLLSVTLVGLTGGDDGMPPNAASDVVPAELAGLLTGRPVRLAVYGTRSVHLPDGAEKVINRDPAETVTKVSRADGAWVVWSINKRRSLAGLTVVRDDESTTSVGTDVVSMATTATGDRMAVQSQVGNEERVEVIELPSGQPVAATPLSGDSHGTPVVNGWAGSLVVLTAPNGDAGPVATDVWDPESGLYSSTPAGARLVLGPAPMPGLLLAMEPDRPGSADACLTWVDPAAAFTVRVRHCQTGYRFGEPTPWVSPDGGHLIAWHPDHDGQVIAQDVRTMVSTPLGLPPHVTPVRVAWEDPDTALIQVSPSPGRLDVLRCRVDGWPCELAPAPRVDGAAPLGLVG